MPTTTLFYKADCGGSGNLFPQLPTRTPIPGAARRGPGHARRNLTHCPNAIGSAAMKLNAPRSIPPSTGGADMLIESKTQFCRHRSSSLHASSIADSQPVVSGKVGGKNANLAKKVWWHQRRAHGRASSRAPTFLHECTSKCGPSMKTMSRSGQ